MHPLGTKVYLLKRYSPNDSFCTFFSESVILCFISQDSIRNPTVMDYINKGLQDTPFTGQHILNFLYNGPEEDRAQDMPNFDWRYIFNLTDQVIRLINRYGEVSNTCNKNTNHTILNNEMQNVLYCLSSVSHNALTFHFQYD